ncbi:MAG: hypothetical protein N2513_00880 [Deltaproteobacteria bacterium]|nr:hypothetical protein [Deltaproteobacteria bacterium]
MEQYQKIVELGIKRKSIIDTLSEREEIRLNGEFDTYELLKKALKSLEKLEKEWEIDHGASSIRDEICLIRFYLNSLEKYLETFANK